MRKTMRRSSLRGRLMWTLAKRAGHWVAYFLILELRMAAKQRSREAAQQVFQSTGSSPVIVARSHLLCIPVRDEPVAISVALLLGDRGK